MYVPGYGDGVAADTGSAVKGRTIDVWFESCAKAIAWGCESVMEPTHLDRWPVQMAYIKDPDGYLIELIEYDGSPPAGVPDPKS